MLGNRLREVRGARGWSQSELARRAGLSRPAISAIEVGRVVPSTEAALRLGRALGARVEDLFALDAGTGQKWAWEPGSLPARAWIADVGGRRWAFPCEPGALGLTPHDIVVGGGGSLAGRAPDSDVTLVAAGCDPAIGLLGSLLQAEGVRMLAFTRSSEAALGMLRDGRVHVGGVHLPGKGRALGNAAAVRKRVGKGHRLIRVTAWQEGVALAPGVTLAGLSAARLARLRWAARESGSGARRCLDELLEGRRARGGAIIAANHREVASALRMGVAEAGVCVELTAAEAGLDFMPVKSEAYDFCYPAAFDDDPRVVKLRDVLQSARFRRKLGELPGYDTTTTGEVRSIE